MVQTIAGLEGVKDRAEELLNLHGVARLSVDPQASLHNGRPACRCTSRTATLFPSLTSPAEIDYPRDSPRFDMRDDETIRERLEQLRGQFLQWGTPDLRVFVITKNELRGWIRALEWVLVGDPEQTLKR